jgi:hypothetical protein
MDRYVIELNVVDLYDHDKRFRSVIDIVANAPVSAGKKLGLPLYSLLCGLRDTDDNPTIVNSVSNENVLVSYFNAFPGSDDLRDQLDRVSALCSDVELDILTRVMLRLTRVTGIPGLAIR